MTTPANVVSFYAEAHWGSRWGVIDAFHPTPHKGLDCGLFHGIVQVPALYGGAIVAVAPSSSVGHYVTVQRPGKALYDTYCHIVPGAVHVGQVVAQGANLGRQAVTQAEGGTAWKGQHTHLALSDTFTGWATWSVHNLDPTPGVISALTSTAGGGIALLKKGSEDMHVIKNIEQGFPTSNWTALVGEFTFYHHPDANSQRFDSRVWEGDVTTCIEVNDGEFTYAMTQAQARIAARDKVWGATGGGSTAPTVDEIAVGVDTKLAPRFDALPAAVIVEQKKPGN